MKEHDSLFFRLLARRSCCGIVAGNERALRLETSLDRMIGFHI